MTIQQISGATWLCRIASDWFCLPAPLARDIRLFVSLSLCLSRKGDSNLYLAHAHWVFVCSWACFLYALTNSALILFMPSISVLYFCLLNCDLHGIIYPSHTFPPTPVPLYTSAWCLAQKTLFLSRGLRLKGWLFIISAISASFLKPMGGRKITFVLMSPSKWWDEKISGLSGSEVYRLFFL